MSSKRVKKARLVKHTHCRNCGVSIPYGQETCGPECEIEYQSFKRREMYKLIGIIIALGIVVVIVFLFS